MKCREECRSRGSRVMLALLPVLLLGTACEDDSMMDSSGPGPYQLTFSLDATFQAPHGGQAISIAVVRTGDGSVLAREDGAVSATQNPSFTFAPGALLEKGVAIEVHYWIDSNIGGGTPAVCDPPAVDHQWSVEFFSPSNDVNFTVSHNPALTEDVCATFD